MPGTLGGGHLTQTSGLQFREGFKQEAMSKLRPTGEEELGPLGKWQGEGWVLGDRGVCKGPAQIGEECRV